MKIKNKTTDIPLKFETQEVDGQLVHKLDEDNNVIVLEYFTVADLLKIAVNKPLSEGALPEEMRLDFAILDKLEDPGEEIEFNKKESERVKKLFSNTRWKQRSKSILEIQDQLDGRN